MTFTYTPASADDITRVRFHSSDTVEEAAFNSDEEIQFAISEYGTWQQATIVCLVKIIGKLSSEPDMKADWLTINLGRSVDGYEKLLMEKRREFGLPAEVAGTVATYRSDSLQTEAPDL